MNDNINDGVWFVYDGDCPICSYAAEALRIRREYGALTILNARENKDHPLLSLISERYLNLDKGMVIYHNTQFYHGKDALRFMAQYADAQNWFNQINMMLFKKKHVATCLYPFLRSMRNLLLKIRGRQMINNLADKKTPIFQAVFGDSWNDLPVVMKRHYANRPYSSDVGVVEGIMDVESSTLGRMMAPFFKMTGTLVPYEGKDVPAKVEFSSSPATNGFHFNRTFYFPNQKPYEFKSVMIPMTGNEMIEVMRFGLCWRMAFMWTGNKVVLEHRGFGLYIFGTYIPLPLVLLMGKGYADETPIDDESFSMSMKIVHSIWGMVFGYSGIFKMVKDVV